MGFDAQTARVRFPRARGRQARSSAARCRSPTASRCRSPTRPGWPRSAPPSPPTSRWPATYTWRSRLVAVVSDGTAVLGPRQHRPGRRAAGDGGQGRAVPRVRRPERRPDRARHHRPGRDRRDRRAHRAVLRRHQPRGHLRAALLRDRGPAARPARHPGVPRRPARHGDRRAGRAAQRRRRHRPHAWPTCGSSCPGAGAAGVACTKILLAAGIGDIAVADSKGIVHRGRAGPDRGQGRAGAPTTNRAGLHRLAGRRRSAGADVFLGLSAGRVGEDAVRTMAPNAIIFALANPNPEVDPEVAHRHAAIVATGRSDYPNQINNVLAFPGVFAGAFDVGAPRDHREHEAGRGRGPQRRRGRRARARLHRADPVRPAGGAGGGGRGRPAGRARRRGAGLTVPVDVVRAAVLEHLAAFNAHDTARVLAGFTPDAVWITGADRFEVGRPGRRLRRLALDARAGADPARPRRRG